MTPPGRRPPGSPSVRRAAVAGFFYPNEPGALRAMVRQFLDQGADAAAGAVDPKAIIAPHAGYRYSGATAGTAWATVRSGRGRITRVILVGPAHRVPLRGIGVPSVDRFDTPLGMVAIDNDLRDRVLELPGVVVSDEAHAEEHSLEVHLPFLREALGEDVRLLPMLVGWVDPEVVGDVIEGVWGGEETVVVASTDLSHYQDDSTAKRIDAETTELILAGRVDEITHERACGAWPVRGLLIAARRRGVAPRLLARCTSGDTAGPRDRVVGYGAFALA